MNRKALETMNARGVSAIRSIAVLALILAAFAGCAPEQSCSPGDLVSCTCTGGRRGEKRCYSDGTGFSSCVCDDYCGDGYCSLTESNSTCQTDCPRCGDGACTGSETVGSCARDCAACGDGVCSTGESASSCVSDCGYCGDGNCYGSETNSSCRQDCPACGDRVCSSSESASSCVEDCGYCGDGYCYGSETHSSCPSDCASTAYCGDGSCNNGESCSSCSQDCGGCTCTPCRSSSDCGSGTYCAWRICDGVAACYPSGGGGSCPTIGGISCPSSANYQTCTATSQCGSYSICLSFGGGSARCIQSCTTDGECTYDSSDSALRPRCLADGDGNKHCYLACASASDVCPYGMTCRPYTGGTYGYCY